SSTCSPLRSNKRNSILVWARNIRPTGAAPGAGAKGDAVPVVVMSGRRTRGRGPHEIVQRSGVPAKTRSDFVGWFCGVEGHNRTAVVGARGLAQSRPHRASGQVEEHVLETAALDGQLLGEDVLAGEPGGERGEQLRSHLAGNEVAPVALLGDPGPGR